MAPVAGGNTRLTLRGDMGKRRRYCRVSTAVVQRFCKPKAGGSNPSPGTIAFSRQDAVAFRGDSSRLKIPLAMRWPFPGIVGHVRDVFTFRTCGGLEALRVLFYRHTGNGCRHARNRYGWSRFRNMAPLPLPLPLAGTRMPPFHHPLRASDMFHYGFMVTGRMLRMLRLPAAQSWDVGVNAWNLAPFILPE